MHIGQRCYIGIPTHIVVVIVCCIRDIISVNMSMVCVLFVVVNRQVSMRVYVRMGMCVFVVCCLTQHMVIRRIVIITLQRERVAIR